MILETEDFESKQRTALIRHSLPYFSRTHIQIETKTPGEVLFLDLNRPQLYLHHQAEKMLREVGFVRIIVVKGRQEGISTYIEIRFFHKALFMPHTKVCVISHEKDSTKALLDKVKFAHDHLQPELRIKLIDDSSTSFSLANNSEYLILTAGSKEAGRSRTAHLQHQSERAFFENPDAIDAGAGEIVADRPGTEIFIESTGNGINHFYTETMDAEKGTGLFRVVFLPWYWLPEYRTKPAIDFKPEGDEFQLMLPVGQGGYGLDEWQLQWRRDKIVKLKSIKKFKQEYPNTLQEAFQASTDSFYDMDFVNKAVQTNLEPDDYEPTIMMVDPAYKGPGADRTVITIRKGHKVLPYIRDEQVFTDNDTMESAGLVAKLIDRYNADKCFIDFGGTGYGIVDRLHERHYRMVEGFSNSDGSSDPRYLNKRAETAHLFKEWLEESGPVDLPNDTEMLADIATLPPPKTNSNGRLKFPSKTEIKDLFKRSPDFLDSLMGTFAYPVRSRKSQQKTIESINITHTERQSNIAALNHFNLGSRRANIPRGYF